jgi:hypothetical protein
LYPPEDLSDRSERFFISETVRGQVFALLRQELPYAVAVEVEAVRAREGTDLTDVEATIYVEKIRRRASSSVRQEDAGKSAWPVRHPRTLGRGSFWLREGSEPAEGPKTLQRLGYWNLTTYCGIRIADIPQSAIDMPLHDGRSSSIRPRGGSDHCFTPASGSPGRGGGFQRIRSKFGGAPSSSPGTPRLLQAPQDIHKVNEFTVHPTSFARGS